MTAHPDEGSDHEDEVTVTRRSLLKRAGAGGALAIASPIVFDSVFSPAAACSGSNVSAAALISWTDIDNDQGTGTSLQSPTTITTVSGSLVVVAINLFWNPDLGSTPTVGVSGPFNTVASLTSSTYHDLGGGDTYRLYVFTARGTGATANVNVTAEVIGFGRVDNFVAQVLQFTSSPQPAIPTSPDTLPGTGATATVALAPAPLSSRGQLLIVAGHPNDVTTGDWSVPAAFPAGSQLADTFSNDGAQDLSLASFYDPVANVGNVSSTFSGSAAITAAATWAATTVEIIC